MGRINWEPINLLSILVCNFNNRNQRWESQRSAFHCWIYKRGCRGDWWVPSEFSRFHGSRPKCKYWTNLFGGLCNTFNKRKWSRQTMDGFMHDTQLPFQNLSQEKIQDETFYSAKSHGSDYWCGWWSYYLNDQRICKKEGMFFMRFSSKVWYERRLYYGEMDDNVCLCKLSAGQKQTFSFYDW